MKQLTIQGMHCNACKTLISMELEEHGLDQLIENIDVNAEEQQGILTLKEEASDAQEAAIVDLITGMEGYQVV